MIPFLGAGVNIGHRPDSAGWAADKLYLPTGRELSKLLAEEASFPATDERERLDLPKVASYFAEILGRTALRERTRELFDRDFPSCSIHDYLAEFAPPGLIVTTNYDDLLERSFRARGRPFDLVVHPTDNDHLAHLAESVLWWRAGAAAPDAIPPNELALDLSRQTAIYKMHGSVIRTSKEWDSYVITEDDYVDFISRMTHQMAIPARFMHHFQERHFLFLGYGLGDWNLRVVLRNLKRFLPTQATHSDLASWAIQDNPTELETMLWKKRNVHLFDLDIGEFVSELRKLDAPAG